MEQALASDMWGTPQFEEAYLQMAEEWEELTDWLEWETPLFKDMGKPCEQLHYWGRYGFDRFSAVASALDALDMVTEEYIALPNDVRLATRARWGALFDLLSRFNAQWGIK